MTIFGGFFQQEDGGLKIGHLILAAVVIAALVVIFGHSGNEAAKVSYPE